MIPPEIENKWGDIFILKFKKNMEEENAFKDSQAYPITNTPTFDMPEIPLTRAQRRKKDRLLKKIFFRKLVQARMADKLNKI